MKQIQIQNFTSTEINSEFTTIINLDIEDKPFAEGGFGEVYHCVSINGNKLSTPQVIKIFKENFPGSSDENLRIIIRLQEKFKDLSSELELKNKKLLEEYPAFISLPQFSFTGYLNGILIKGFSSTDLTLLGYHEFEKVLTVGKLRDKFYNIPIPRRIFFAYQLTSAFKVLDDFKYIHADLKPAALFLNLDDQKLAIIDFDSGVITETSDDKPSTWGSPNEWVAPEIWEQQIKLKRGDKINVDSFTDRWSVAIGINYLISGIHPLFYLTELGPSITRNYFGSTSWPDADINASYFCRDNEEIYKQYINFINKEIPPQIKEKMSYTINFGYKISTARTTYKDWQTALKSIQLPPIVKFLTVSKNEIIEGETVTVVWNSENANSVEFENFSNIFGPIDKLRFQPKTSKTYKITFRGYYGEFCETIDIKVIPAPKFVIFKSDNSKIKKGQSTTLFWEIDNITQGKIFGIENDFHPISKSGRIIVKPEKSTTYKFQVTSLDSITLFDQYITIEVFEEGIINYFKTDRQFVFPTIPVTLSWNVQNALKLEIVGLGEFSLIDQVIVYPLVDTTYVLRITDNFEVITSKIQIKMLPLPLIETIIIETPIVHSFSNINISVPNFTANFSSLPKSLGFKQMSYKCDLNTSNFPANPKIKVLEYQLIKMPFIKRIKKILSTIKEEFQNEKNKYYVTKK